MSESNRDIRYIEALIDGMGAEFQKGFRQWLTSQPSIAECLPLTRAEDLAFQPSAMTAAERAHVAGCRYCLLFAYLAAAQELPTPPTLDTPRG